MKYKDVNAMEGTKAYRKLREYRSVGIILNRMVETSCKKMLRSSDMKKARDQVLLVSGEKSCR